jgi:hypothetical protein
MEMFYKIWTTLAIYRPAFTYGKLSPIGLFTISKLTDPCQL